ncbi:glycerophosphodiester phosphodiesterase [Microlunatus sp. GCM10028923]|uniref:glycerophosphodiester phosphodiesterase n=1 Tax=Microlunatus sp. GCM10028923 TaxID=3273400 RepID=UPI00360A79CF
MESLRRRHKITFAHRGLCGRHPENTPPSLAAAIPYADYCEIDVRVTADDQLVLMHDATRIPTLREALELLAGTTCGALLELKTDSMELVAAELTRHLADHPDARVAAASVVPARSAELRRLLPESIIGVLFLDAGTITDAEIAGYADYADFLCFRTDRITAALVDRVHRAGLLIMHNTNTRAFMDEGALAGADGTMTDWPDRREESHLGVAAPMIEAESLLGVARTSGPLPRRRGDHGLGFKFSGRAGLAVDLAAGDWLEVPFVAGPGRTAVHCALVRHPAGGVLDVALDGAPRAKGVDLRGPSPSQRTIEISEALAAGPHRLRFTAVDAAPGTLLLDGLALRS